MTTTKSTCCYCGVGCGVLIHSDNGRITGVDGDPDHPANFGRLCTKGASLHFTAAETTTRALHPELRSERAAPRARVSWDCALDHAAERFANIIREHGPDAVAFYVSGQLLSEDYFVFNKLARALVGTNNIDSNSRLCMSSAVSGYKQTLGADAPPCSYEDLELADMVMIAGANPAYAHPIAFRRLLDAKAARPEMKLVVIDPRLTDTASAADLHLQIEPGTDALLFSAMLHVLVWDGLIAGKYIAAHTSGFDAARDAVREITPEFASRICGVKAEDIVTAARWFGNAGAALSLWCQGLNQSSHGTSNNAALIHLHLATGQIGRPGAGPFSLTGQPNAMGGRETGTMATILPGHRDPGNAEDRAELARFWDIAALPATPGKSAVELFEAMRQGSIKAVWIACTNPAQSLPEQATVRAALQRAEFVVLQEAYADTETAPYADLLLPAASWGEKAGSVTNSERRISRVRAAVPPPGSARADWDIAADFARRLGRELGRDDAERLFAYAEPGAIFAEHVALTAGRDLDHSGLTAAILDARGPQQWPFPAGAATGTARLYSDGRFAHADGRARFVTLDLASTAEATSARFPLALNTGRLRDQWHGMSRTGKLGRLGNHAETPALGLHPADLERRDLKPGDLAEIASPRGRIVLPVTSDPALKPGHAFMPMHFGRRRLSHAGVNELTTPAFDPLSKQPELKHAAIRVTPAALPWRGVVLRAAEGPDAHAQILAWEAALAPSLDRFAYAALTLSGRDRVVVTLTLAHPETPPEEWLIDLDVAVMLDRGAGDVLEYADAARGISKKVRIDAGRLAGARLAGEVAAAGWIKAGLLEGAAAAPLRRWLLAPVAEVPASAGANLRGRIICSCLDVAERDIARAIAGGAGLAELQTKLKCGTSCGSCVPEIKRLLTQTPAA